MGFGFVPTGSSEHEVDFDEGSVFPCVPGQLNELDIVGCEAQTHHLALPFTHVLRDHY